MIVSSESLFNDKKGLCNLNMGTFFTDLSIYLFIYLSFEEWRALIAIFLLESKRSVGLSDIGSRYFFTHSLTDFLLLHILLPMLIDLLVLFISPVILPLNMKEVLIFPCSFFL